MRREQIWYRAVHRVLLNTEAPMSVRGEEQTAQETKMVCDAWPHCEEHHQGRSACMAVQHTHASLTICIVVAGTGVRLAQNAELQCTNGSIIHTYIRCRQANIQDEMQC